MKIFSDDSCRGCLLAALGGLVVSVAGCSGPTDPPATFEPNLVHAMKYEIQNDLPMDQALQDANWVVTQMFGTANEPKLPEVITGAEDLSKLVSLDRLVRASGPADAEGRGLFRKHCVICHGVTGNGRGPAGISPPYPRDYRMGVFKFKSTPRGVKPTRDDLARSIRNGIAGTAMKPIPTLTEDDIQALVDYVIYLSMRGELERTQLDDGVMEGIIEDGERLIDSDFGALYVSDPQAAGQDAAKVERFEEDWGYAEEYAEGIAKDWLAAGGRVVQIPDPPAELPLAESYADVVAIRESDQSDAFEASVRRGQELFVGKSAICSKCHGEKGLGDGQTTDYDDWTKDWTLRAGLKPDDRESLIPLLARGAMPPVNAIPRNFADGVFRGGPDSKDLYLRITQGIDGTPMPAATFVEGDFEQEDVWHLINFIRSLQTDDSASQTGPVPAPAA